jgi:hypothetical protein
MKRRDALPTSRAAYHLQSSTQHIINLFYRGDIDGFFKGRGRGLMIYEDSLETYKKRLIEE